MPRQQLREAPGPQLKAIGVAESVTVTKQTLVATPFAVVPLVQAAIVLEDTEAGTSTARLQLDNAGPQALRLTVYRHHLVDLPADRYDLMPGQTLSVAIPVPHGIYDIAVHGADGFLRTIAGDTASTLAGFEAELKLSGPSISPGLLLQLSNSDRITRLFKVSNRIGPATTYRIAPGGSHELRLQPLQQDAGWYDLTVTVDGVSTFSRRFAGHLAAGRPATAARMGDS
jgi:phospholipase C